MSQISQPAWPEDTPTRCRVFFTHIGPIANHVHSLGPFVSPNGNWWIPTLNVSEGNRALAAGGDFVNIMAGTTMQHIVQPPGADHVTDFPFGQPVTFGGVGAGPGGPGINAAAFPQGGVMRNSFDVVHDVGHVDHYELSVSITVQGPNITAYRISLFAEHIVVAVAALVDDEQEQVQRRQT